MALLAVLLLAMAIGCEMWAADPRERLLGAWETEERDLMGNPLLSIYFDSLYLTMRESILGTQFGGSYLYDIEGSAIRLYAWGDAQKDEPVEVLGYSLDGSVLSIEHDGKVYALIRR